MPDMVERAAYNIASAAAERFRVELHYALGIDPTPSTGGGPPSQRLDDDELIARVREAIG